MEKEEIIRQLAEEVSNKTLGTNARLEDVLKEAHYKLKKWNEEVGIKKEEY